MMASRQPSRMPFNNWLVDKVDFLLNYIVLQDSWTKKEPHYFVLQDSYTLTCTPQNNNHTFPLMYGMLNAARDIYIRKNAGGQICD